MRSLTELIDSDTAKVTRAVDLSPLDGSSLLITGASGLLGTYLLATLHHWMRESGRKVEVAAICRSSPPPLMTDIFKNRHIRFLQADLAEPAAAARLPVADHVIHAVGYAQPSKFLEDPVKTIRINTTATIEMLERLPFNGKFLFLSSSEVYSGSKSFPHREDDIGTTNPSHPRACYIEGKRSGETICNAFRKQGRDTKSARLALAYGPGTRADDQRVLSSFIRRALVDKRIALLDRGIATRTYCYISDVTEMLLSILLYGREPVYNVGGRSKTTILELVYAIGKEVGVPVEAPPDTGDATGAPQEVALDLSRVCDEFGKRDFVSLEEGLRQSIEWQRHLRGQS